MIIIFALKICIISDLTDFIYRWEFLSYKKVMLEGMIDRMIE
jgi:hypothetical protein